MTPRLASASFIVRLGLGALLCLSLGVAMADDGAPQSGAATGRPLPWGTQAASTHVPYSMGECAACHERKGPEPGPPAQRGDERCLRCHEDLTPHAHAFRNCVKCHNAHDSQLPKLLRSDLGRCPNCHAKD